MTRKLFCDLHQDFVDELVGQIALGKNIDIDGKSVPILDICPKCRNEIMEKYGLKEYVEPPKEEAKE